MAERLVKREEVTAGAEEVRGVNEERPEPPRAKRKPEQHVERDRSAQDDDRQEQESAAHRRHDRFEIAELTHFFIEEVDGSTFSDASSCCLGDLHGPRPIVESGPRLRFLCCFREYSQKSGLRVPNAKLSDGIVVSCRSTDQARGMDEIEVMFEG